MAKRGTIKRVACYLADILTLTRIFLAVFLLFIVIFNFKAEWALIVFAIGELTDAFDGTCSKKWPFEKGKEPKYRKYAEKYDIFADVFLISMMALYVVVRVNPWMWLVLIAVAVNCTIVELIAYHRIMGHPNDCSPNSLYAKNPRFAEKLLLARRTLVYLPSIAAAIVLTLFATSWPIEAKWIVLGVTFAEAVFLWFFLKARRNKVARD